MVVDFQHHYVPKDLALKKGLYSDKVAFAKEDGIPSITMHSKLYVRRRSFEIWMKRASMFPSFPPIWDGMGP